MIFNEPLTNFTSISRKTFLEITSSSLQPLLDSSHFKLVGSVENHLEISFNFNIEVIITYINRIEKSKKHFKPTLSITFFSQKNTSFNKKYQAIMFVLKKIVISDPILSYIYFAAATVLFYIKNTCEGKFAVVIIFILFLPDV